MTSLMSSETIKHTQVFIFLPDFNQILNLRQIFIRVHNIKFHGNTASGSRTGTVHADRRTDEEPGNISAEESTREDSSYLMSSPTVAHI